MFQGWIIRGRLIPWLASWFFSVGGITLFPFIFVHPDHESDRLINHERIHIEQQKETLVIGFYAVYLFDWLSGLRARGPKGAYQSIRFEMEAYNNDDNQLYIPTRQAYAWMDYSVGKDT